MVISFIFTASVDFCFYNSTKNNLFVLGTYEEFIYTTITNCVCLLDIYI